MVKDITVYEIFMQLDVKLISKQLDEALLEDYGVRGDITTKSTISSGTHINFEIRAREKLVLSGAPIAIYFLENYSSANFAVKFEDASLIKEGATIISGRGRAHEVFLLERVILNYMQHLSGIATQTAKFVHMVEGTGVKICDTRKTLPGLRNLQKYAVRCGGGHNHRLTLDSAIMIKDNHIAAAGNIRNALELAKNNNPHFSKIEIECDNLEQVIEALDCGVDIILLDNMSIENLKKAVVLIKGQAIIEASGGIKLKNVAEVAASGVDIISIGSLTHSVTAADIGLDIV